MDRVLVLLLAALAMFNNGTAEPQDDTRTIGDIHLEWYNRTIEDIELRVVKAFDLYLNVSEHSLFVPVHGAVPDLPLAYEINAYLLHLQYAILTAFVADLSGTPLQSIYKDLNQHCAGSLETAIVDLTVEPSNMTCVSIRLRKMMRSMVKKNIGVGLKIFSDLCEQQLKSLCEKGPTHCTTAYEGKVAEILSNHVKDVHDLGADNGTTPLEFINIFMAASLAHIMMPYYITYYFLICSAYISSASELSSIEPFTFENMIAILKKETNAIFYRNKTETQSTDESNWGIVKTRAGSITFTCSDFRDTYERESEQYLTFFINCYIWNVINLSTDLIGCAYSNNTSRPLTWLTVPSAYFHSPCLCLIYNDTDCGVKAPQGVDPRIYCLSVLLRDFQRQASYRPAITYLDYSFQTRIPVCQFSNIFQIKFRNLCKVWNIDSISLALPVQCYFKDLVNKQLNCSESLIVNTYNETILCGLVIFIEFVLCDGDSDVEVPVPYYRAGDSSLVLFLTYGDVVVRVLTIVTYLACKQLRNLPGKLLVAYLATALLRLVVVQATLADMAMAVRLDVALDLSTTLWLTCYLHFLTVCIRDLRPPDSLSRKEARMVLLRYSLLGWVFPAVLSIAFFSMDEFIDSHIQIGHLLFVLCNYVALFANLFMCYVNCSFYLDVKKSARKLKKGSRKRDVFAAIFNFAIKTSVLSGAGITIRLAFTQIQGLEQLLSYYHVMGSLQGLLVFLLYGCNREARTFWLQVVRSILLRFRRPQNVPV